MKILDHMGQEGFEEVIAVNDPSCGLAGFLVIHSTARGPAAGGIRVFPYRSEEQALSDGFQLARAMTYKAAAADLAVGGGKIVLIEHADLVWKEALHAVGRLLQSLGGRFLAGRDVGVSVDQGAWVRGETRFMVDETEDGVGDLNRATAWGVEAGARAALEHRFGVDDWKGVRVAIQGAGGVGGWMARMLHHAGAELVVADPQSLALEALGREVPFLDVGVEEIYSATREVFCPCAVGGVLNEATVERLTAGVVAGSANNVLSEPRIGDILHERGVAYVPDYLVNAGALIQGVRFLLGGERDSREAIHRIGDRTRRLLDAAAHLAEPAQRILDRETRLKLGPRRGWREWAWPAG